MARCSILAKDVSPFVSSGTWPDDLWVRAGDARCRDRREEEFTLTPEKAYGMRDEVAIQKVPKSQFPDDMQLVPGMVLGAQSDRGPVQFSVVSIDGDEVTVDFNHQMAGMTLRFSVEVVGIREPTRDELAHGHAHGVGGINH